MDLEFLRTVPFLEAVLDDDLIALGRLVETVDFASGDCILAEGAPIDALYIVHRGTVHVRKHSEGDAGQILLARIGRGTFFGEVNLFCEGKATADIFAMDAVRLARLPYVALKEFMEQRPLAGYRIVSALMSELANRLKQTNDRLLNSVYWQRAGRERAE